MAVEDAENRGLTVYDRKSGIFLDYGLSTIFGRHPCISQTPNLRKSLLESLQSLSVVGACEDEELPILIIVIKFNFEIIS
jgi:hypothetical protein